MTTETIISIVLGIAGIIATYLFTKWQMRRNRIAHFIVNSYDIGKGLSDEFPDFELRVGSEKLSKNVWVLKGGFMNIGKRDIGESQFTQKLPNNCSVRAINIYPSVSELDVTYTICDKEKNSVVFQINNIFGSDEYFEYTAIVEVPNTMGSVEKELSFQHRILNTDKIKNVYIGQSDNSQSTVRSIVIGTIAAILGIIGTIISIFNIIESTNVISNKILIVIICIMVLAFLAIILFDIFWNPQRRITRVLKKTKNNVS